MSKTPLEQRRIPLDWITFAEEGGEVLNPRGVVTDTTDLQASMRLIGQLSPVTVVNRDGKHIVVDGHRRVIAARQLGWEKIAVVTVHGEDNLLPQMLGSNVRQEVKPSKLGKAIQKLSLDNQWGIERSAMVCGLKVDKAQLLVDLTSAPEALQKRVDKGEMSLSAWRTLRDKPRQVQEDCAEMEKPTVRNVRKAVKQQQGETNGGMMGDMLNALSPEENTLVRSLNAVKTRLMAEWQGLGDSERVRVAVQVQTMQEFIQEMQDAVTVTG